MQNFELDDEAIVAETNTMVAKVGRETDPLNPREDWDNLGTFFSNHRRYSPDGHSIEELADEDGNLSDEEIAKNYIFVRVYAYIHGGMTVKAAESNPFSCPWDSGLFAIYAVDREKARKEYGELTEETTGRIKQTLAAEVDTYDQYLNGDVWMIVTVNTETDEVVDCIGGFFGREYAEEEAKAMLEVA